MTEARIIHQIDHVYVPLEEPHRSVAEALLGPMRSTLGDLDIRLAAA